MHQKILAWLMIADHGLLGSDNLYLEIVQPEILAVTHGHVKVEGNTLNAEDLFMAIYHEQCNARELRLFRSKI